MVVILRQLVVRMIVALRTLHADAEKNLGERLGTNLRLAQRAIVVGRRVLIAAASAGDQLTSENIERLVVGDALANPGVEHLHALLVELLFLDAQQVGPFRCPGVGELGAFEQRVDQLRSLVRAGVAQEFARLVWRR